MQTVTPPTNRDTSPPPTEGLPEAMQALLQDADALQFHADQVRVNGYTVLPNALPVEFIARMRDRFDQLLEAYRAAQPTNRGANRYQMYLPFEPPFSDPILYEHPAALAIIERVLGPDLLWSYLASDTPLPGSDYQNVHSDTRLLFPETNFSAPPYGLVINVPLVTVTEENGPLEIWPGGTHYMPGRVDLQKLAATMTSLRLLMNEGDLLIRDLRAWHRGTPNRGTRSRPNVALVYTRPWYRFEQKPPALTRRQLEGVSEKARTMLRHAHITDD
ncbi:MAG: phytanoyl-CoA dioxygenase family protein [Armatimonadetes bacterium]|nr:phytanoyl-CoA dioxygenase family protein [Armatimonadota bacterium]